MSELTAVDMIPPVHFEIMHDVYKAWIRENVHEAYGHCEEMTLAMNKEFPELTRVRGHYHCPIWNQAREHWWLKNEVNEIVDPTVEQFPSAGIGEYEEWEEGKPEPTGKCPNCGDYCYDGNSMCSDRCSTEYMKYLNEV